MLNNRTTLSSVCAILCTVCYWYNCICQYGTVHITEHRDAFALPLLQWQCNNCYIACLSVCLCVCILALVIATCKSHLLSAISHCHLSVPHFLANGKIFEKKNSKNKMCVLTFPATFVCNISHCKESWARYDRTVYRSAACTVPTVCVTF